MRPCGICGNAESNRVVRAKEMMFGLQDPFDYLECSRCGCIQLLEVPSDWSRYYPPNYYSFQPSREGSLKRMLKRLRSRQALGDRSVLGAILLRKWGVPPFVRWIEPAGLRWDDAILDVGSGSGQILGDMSAAGFSNLTGVDPFIPADATMANGVRLLKRRLGEVSGSFDFVMMNQSFEHMDDPKSRLLEAARLLPAGRMLLLRIPVAGKFAWREYEADWVQLDPPRHLFIHSEESIRILAASAGFTVREIRYDSDSFQFWGSEQYRRGIPLHDARSYAVDPARSSFSPRQIDDYQGRADALNASGDGDQASFYLVRV
ncbi:MAG TPA: class I SAM-dependent methyltransferase [Candidatus Eisenbacteria bacterium]|nr:class I SAM-dependent methyltransferase [Candidatus Eisenbacteria bacterium]